MQETQETYVQSLGQEDPQRRKWHPIPVFLPGKFQGQRSLAGYSRWGHKEWDMTEGLSTIKEVRRRGERRHMVLSFTKSRTFLKDLFSKHFIFWAAIPQREDRVMVSCLKKQEGSRANGNTNVLGPWMILTYEVGWKLSCQGLWGSESIWKDNGILSFFPIR